MRRLLLSLTMMVCGLPTCLAQTDATPDPNFYIYLCFGQSNMEGNAQWEAQDEVGISDRFLMLATTDFDSPKRTMGQWYKAVPPIVSPVGKLGMADYFGRTMTEQLPEEVRIGVVDVAIGGCDIRMFDKDQYQDYAKADNWSGQLAREYYGGNPYQRLISLAKEAQKVGVVKGILLHQGETNNGDANWPNMVMKIYRDILVELGMTSSKCPLFAGETLRREYGGACYAHNTQVNRLPTVIKNSHVISSEGCEGNGQDPWHFCAEGYRIMGKRYAEKVLEVMGTQTAIETAATTASTPAVAYTLQGTPLPARQWSSLPKGLYIVNGKKMLKH